MGWLENVIFKNQEMANERLELTDKNSLYYLSTGLTLRHCTVVLKVPASRLVIKQATFIDCTFEVKQELKNHQSWVSASLKGCRFKGRFSGCDFGHWTPLSSRLLRMGSRMVKQGHLGKRRVEGSEPMMRQPSRRASVKSQSSMEPN